MKNQIPHMARLAALAGLALAASAVMAQAQDLKALPGGGALKDVPAFKDLPGVHLNLRPEEGGAPQATCVEKPVTTYQYGWGEVGRTMQECNFGNFSIGTMGSTSNFGIPGMQQFHGHYHPVPDQWRPR